ncbi:hypothetical protein KC19_12G158700 [Ceratodon purpureus]|uniref:Uncharacterized protein n=1 Tax=Ceratodon purpureus TaxID=3225 RepID=A0A8T0GDK5_CERPU|nr:hypothetical protein KC19_12G158700 [Ceratodon purpureus]
MAGEDKCVIFLVRERGGSPSSKRRRTESKSAEYEEVVDKIYADSSRLRQCSKYFETCMKKRWAPSKPLSSQMEFHLELQAHAVYYRECFSRMKPLDFLKPIRSVEHCLELLKIAQQIMYQDLVDLGIKYLSAAPWTSDEEKQIRSFCTLGHFFLDGTVHMDLVARLRLPLTEKERTEEFSKFTQSVVLSQYLEKALWELSLICVSVLSKGSELHEVSYLKRSCKLYEDACRKIMLGDNEYAQVECVRQLKTETMRLLLSFKDCSWDKFFENLTGFYRLYKLLRSFNAAQPVVDLLMKDKDLRFSMHCREELLDNDSMAINKKWVKFVYSMFLDLLDGRLFLSSSDRYTLFMDFCTAFDMCFQDSFNPDEVTDTFTTYIMTFPPQKQLEMIRCWEMRKDDSCGTHKFFIFETHEEWMMRLVSKLAYRHALAVTDAEEPSDTGEQ